MMDQFSHFTRTQDRHNTLIMLLLVNTPTPHHPGPPRPALHLPRYRRLVVLAWRLSAEIVMQRDISSPSSVDIVTVARRCEQIVWAGPKDPWVAGWRLLRAAL